MHGTLTQHIDGSRMRLRPAVIDDFRTYILMLAADCDKQRIEQLRVCGGEVNAEHSALYRKYRMAVSILREIARNAELPFPAWRWNNASYELHAFTAELVASQSESVSACPNDADDTPP